MESNSIIYIFADKYQLYKIHTVHDNLLLCHEQGYFEHAYKETPELNWGHVGVFKEGGISDETKIIYKSQVHGKIIRICNLLITVPINILRES